MTNGNNICFSGGAIGADTVFGEQAKKAGHQVYHFGFRGMKSTNDLYYLTSIQLLAADQFIKEVNETVLHRGNFDKYYEYTKNLLRRNYYQIYKTHKVYAISYLKDDICQGGTGWAVHLAIQLKVPEIYVFDQCDNLWFQWNKYSWAFLNDNPPRPHGLYTGIGSVEITDDGKHAIEKLYSTGNM